jgi:hypothetical protein
VRFTLVAVMVQIDDDSLSDRKRIRMYLALLHPDKHAGRGDDLEAKKKVALMNKIAGLLNEVYARHK